MQEMETYDTNDFFIGPSNMKETISNETESLNGYSDEVSIRNFDEVDIDST